MNAYRHWIAFALIVTIVLATSGLSATHAHNSPPNPWPTVPPQQPSNGPWVVRATFTDRCMVDALATWTEPWEVHHDEGYLIVAVDRVGYERLLAAGFGVEVDPELTEQLNAPRAALPDQTSGIPGYTCYRTVEETYTSAEDIVTNYPQLATWIDIGDSWEKDEPGGAEGYDLMVLVLTNAAVSGPKPRLFVMSSVHAREYAPAELNTRFAEYLVQNHGVDPDVTWLLDYHEIHLLLQANPDGRKWAEASYYWRKNTDNDFCTDTDYRGVDLNRNFSFQWGCCNGSSTYECDSTYRGPSAASEPETQAIEAYAAAIFPDQREPDLSATAPATATGVFLDIHSYGQLVLWPWGFTATDAPNGTALQTLGRKFAYFNDYSPEQAMSLYATDGATDDFAYGELGVAAYTFEVGTSFFQNCIAFENKIVPDNIQALLYAAKVARTPYQTPAGPDVTTVSVSPDDAPQGQSALLTATIDDTRFNNENGAEPTQIVSAAEFYIDTPPWITSTVPVAHPMAAADGAFDETVEDVTAAIDTRELSLGRHIVFVRGRDAAGNWGAVTAAWLDISEAPPQADFTSDAPVVLGEPVHFTSTVAGTPPFDYLWDFGDQAGTSIESAPVYTYATAGAFTVTLAVTNNVGSDVVSHTVDVVASAVYSLTMTPTEDGQTVSPGEVATYALAVTNRGNLSDWFALEASGNEWDVILAPAITPELYPGETSVVTVSVPVPLDAPGGQMDVATISATSQQGGEISATSRLTTAARTIYGVDLASDAIDSGGAPGDAVPYTLSVSNVGNVTDTFEISASGGIWGIALSPTQVGPLAAGAKGTTTLTVSIPSTATIGAEDTVTVTARSEGDSLEKAYVSLTTTAWAYIYMPVVMRE